MRTSNRLWVYIHKLFHICSNSGSESGAELQLEGRVEFWNGSGVEFWLKKQSSDLEVGWNLEQWKCDMGCPLTSCPWDLRYYHRIGHRPSPSALLSSSSYSLKLSTLWSFSYSEPIPAVPNTTTHSFHPSTSSNTSSKGSLETSVVDFPYISLYMHPIRPQLWSPIVKTSHLTTTCKKLRIYS